MVPWQQFSLDSQLQGLGCALQIFTIPVVPHKAVAEVSKMGNPEESLVVVNHGWQSDPLMDYKVVEVVLFEVVTLVAVVTWSATSPTTS